jgi:uncharacterized protein
MLELRPNCELCDKDLPVDADDACICSYECTFCRDCVDGELFNVCPNCGGGFVSRPIRPLNEWRSGVNRDNQLPSVKRVHSRHSSDSIYEFVTPISDIPAEKR